MKSQCLMNDLVASVRAGLPNEESFAIYAWEKSEKGQTPRVYRFLGLEARQEPAWDANQFMAWLWVLVCAYQGIETPRQALKGTEPAALRFKMLNMLRTDCDMLMDSMARMRQVASKSELIFALFVSPKGWPMFCEFLFSLPGAFDEHLRSKSGVIKPEPEGFYGEADVTAELLRSLVLTLSRAEQPQPVLCLGEVQSTTISPEFLARIIKCAQGDEK